MMIMRRNRLKGNKYSDNKNNGGDESVQEKQNTFRQKTKAEL